METRHEFPADLPEPVGWSLTQAQCNNLTPWGFPTLSLTELVSVLCVDFIQRHYAERVWLGDLTRLWLGHSRLSVADV
jgi:hypothetical protein